MLSVVFSFLLLPQAAILPPAKNQAPQLQTERFTRDLREKNIGDILSLYTPGAVLLDPNGKSYKGEEELRKAYDESIAKYDTDLHLDRKSFDQTGTFGIEHGDYSGTQRDRATGEVHPLLGSYVFLYERQPNGEWHIAHQKWVPAKKK